MMNPNDDVGFELSAMQMITDALGSLPDEASRDRVVRRVLERYRTARSAETTPPQTRARRDVPLAEPQAGLTVEDTNLDSMVQDFAADFERFAREWQHA